MKQFLVLIDGGMGAGKTTVSRLLWEQADGTALIGLDKIKRFVSGFKRNKKQNEKARQVVRAMAEEYLKQGLNVIVEQGMYERHINDYRAIATRHGVTFFHYELVAPRSVLIERVHQRSQAEPPKPGAPSFPPSRILRNMRITAQKTPVAGVTRIDTAHATPEAIAARILKDIRNSRKK